MLTGRDLRDFDRHFFPFRSIWWMSVKHRVGLRKVKSFPSKTLFFSRFEALLSLKWVWNGKKSQINRKTNFCLFISSSKSFRFKIASLKFGRCFFKRIKGDKWTWSCLEVSLSPSPFIKDFFPSTLYLSAKKKFKAFSSLLLIIVHLNMCRIQLAASGLAWGFPPPWPPNTRAFRPW